MKNNLLKMLVMFCAIFSLIAVAGNEANAQRRVIRRVVVSTYQIDQTIRRVETRADRFVAVLNDSLDRSRLEDTNLEDRLNQRARALGDATDKLRREFDRGDSLQENRQYVRACLDIASDIDVSMRRRRFGAKTENTWAVLRSELNSLARYYGLPGVGRAYR